VGVIRLAEYGLLSSGEKTGYRIVQLILLIVDSECMKHITGNLKLLCNFVEKFMGTVHFGNDQFALIYGYRDLVQGNVTINRVYYLEDLNHNLFSVGQFCDADLEVAFRNLHVLLEIFRVTIYSPVIVDLISIPFPFKNQHHQLHFVSWLRPHLNFNYINPLSKKDVVIGLPKLKYVKDQLCSFYELSKAKRSSFKSKVVPSSKGRLNLLHMDLCGPMRVASINGKKYILVIVDDYSRYTWTLFLHSKDETPEVLKEFLTMIQRNLQAPVITVRTDKAYAHVPSQQELNLLFGPLYDEFFNACSNPQNKQPTTNIQPTSAPSTPINVHAEENNDNQAEEEHLPDDEFTNPFCAPAQEVTKSSSHNIGNLNVPTFNQPQVSEYRWIKDHPLEQVHGNLSMPVQKRQQLATDPKMCMFALTVSKAKPKDIKEAMADSARIEAMQEELHQFDRLQEEVYVAQPDGFVDPDHPEKVYRLTKALYGMKQAPRHDADHTGCIDSCKSISRGIQFLGDKLVSWMSKKQNCTAMSSAEAKYVALSASYAQVIWMRTQLQDYGFNYIKIPLYLKMEILLEPTSNKLLVGDLRDSI
nr:hypothetical protein [Tanacetum cinerariifolium]